MIPRQQLSLPLTGDDAQIKSSVSSPSSGRFSDLIVYVDESGDHGLQPDPDYPIFVLAFCVFYKEHYCEKVVPALEKLKFHYFGHDRIVLHEHDIRKGTGKFNILKKKQQKEMFIEQLTDIIETVNFILISCVIDKSRLRGRSEQASDPYHIALDFCLETLYEFLKEKNQGNTLTHVVVESRGEKEDRSLELEFRRICDGNNRMGLKLPFDIVFDAKKANSSGLQLADLVARPIGLHVLRPNQANRAFDVLRKKFFCSGGRRNVGAGFENWGLKIYPPPESERPR